MSDVTINLKGLEQILKALKRRPPLARLGVLGGNAARSGSQVTNAQIAAWHEYGTSTTPQRSFLRIPLQERLTKEIEASGALDKDVLAKVIASGSVLPWLQKIMIVAEGVVADAFDTGGFGKWAPLKPNTLARKRVAQILVETQQLRNSITSEVKD